MRAPRLPARRRRRRPRRPRAASRRRATAVSTSPCSRGGLTRADAPDAGGDGSRQAHHRRRRIRATAAGYVCAARFDGEIVRYATRWPCGSSTDSVVGQLRARRRRARSRSRASSACSRSMSIAPGCAAIDRIAANPRTCRAPRSVAEPGLVLEHGGVAARPSRRRGSPPQPRPASSGDSERISLGRRIAGESLDGHAASLSGFAARRPARPVLRPAGRSPRTSSR